MPRKRVLFAACLAVAAVAGCDQPARTAFQGYAEGEYVLVASPYAGALEALHVARGQTIEAGASLFTLEQANESAAKREADERLRAAQAKLDNLRRGLRAPEVDARLAEIEQAEAARRFSAAQLERSQKLYAQGFISSSDLDQWKANLDRDRARVEESRAQLKVAAQSVGRAGELAAAQAEMDAARAVVEQAQWRLAQKAQRAPQAGLVHDTFFVQGEWVPAGKPVVSLLPPQNILLRFFVPETAVGRLRIGSSVSVTCDGCGAPIPATVSYVATQAEYTPPVIYSREERAKLVFMAEARPAAADATRLKPGQPVDVKP
jgi:HlyD family secretion protein